MINVVQSMYLLFFAANWARNLEHLEKQTWPTVIIKIKDRFIITWTPNKCKTYPLPYLCILCRLFTIVPTSSEALNRDCKFDQEPQTYMYTIYSNNAV